MAKKPDIIIEAEARQMIANGVNYTIQQTGISMIRLEPILKEIYNEVQAQAQKEYAEIQQQYEQEVAAEEAANNNNETHPEGEN